MWITFQISSRCLYFLSFFMISFCVTYCLLYEARQFSWFYFHLSLPLPLSLSLSLSIFCRVFNWYYTYKWKSVTSKVLQNKNSMVRWHSLIRDTKNIKLASRIFLVQYRSKWDNILEKVNMLSKWSCSPNQSRRK